MAEYFLAKRDDDAGELISNLKIQKLVYYAQGVYLALFNEPLFPESIEAWTHGPVVPDLYHEYKGYGDKAIDPPTGIDFKKYNKRTREVLDEVYAVFGQFSAWKLRQMTHKESPWKETMDSGGGVITHQLLHEHFDTIVTHE
ncbi:MAG TPA: type II toxin-antitoxin system antitoxin SocA domain-containing protein [Armatimonadota bacterium]